MFLKKLFILVLLFYSSALFAGVGTQFSYYKNHPQAQPTEDVVKTLKNYHVIFVAGFGNEVESFTRTFRLTSGDVGYMIYNAKVMSDLGITTSIYRPSSFETIEDSADVLYRRIDELYARGDGKPIIFVSHSRGVPTVANLLLTHPELIKKNIVKKNLGVQGLVFGNDFPKYDFFSIVGRLWLLGESGFSGFRSLEAGNVERAVGSEMFYSLKKPEQKLVNDASLWFASSKPFDGVNSHIERKFAKAYADAAGNLPNDSVLATVNMWREDYGNLVGYLENLSHLEPFALFGNVSKESAMLTIRSFTYAIADSLVENLRGSSDDARLVSAGVKGRINLMQPERPHPAPADPSLIRECVTLLKLLLPAKAQAAVKGL